MANKALDSGYAIVAISNLKGTKGCWERDDVQPVARKLQQWRTKRNLPGAGGVPLYILGVGSGGWFAANAARVWPNVSAVSVQSSVPTLREVQRTPTGAESKAKPYPPLQLVMLERDEEKLFAAKQLLEQEWDGSKRAEVLTGKKQMVTPEFFSDGITGMRQNLSEAVRRALVVAGTVDDNTGFVVKAPVRSELQKKISEALGTRKSDLPQRSKSLALDAIFARLDMAYAKEASTCAMMDKTIAFFAQYGGSVSTSAVGVKGRPLNSTRSSSHHGSGTHHGDGTHHGNSTHHQHSKHTPSHHSSSHHLSSSSASILKLERKISAKSTKEQAPSPKPFVRSPLSTHAQPSSKTSARVKAPKASDKKTTVAAKATPTPTVPTPSSPARGGWFSWFG